MKARIFIIVLSLLSLFLTQTLTSQVDNRKSLNVTVYNSNLGVVKEVREIQLTSGISEMKITDVAQQIVPTSVHIKLDGTVLEQNYQYDLVSFNKILEKYIDKQIELISDKNFIKGTLLSVTSSQIVLRKDDGGLLMLPKLENYQISVGSLPEGLITRPTLVWAVKSKSSGKSEVELSYQTGGLNWHTEYVAVLNKDDSKMSLNSWVSIENKSGATYKDANLKLIAGDVNIVKDIIRGGRNKMMGNVMLQADAMQPQFDEKEFFEYHIYNLQRQTTLADNETKQISLFEADDIKINKKYLFKSGVYYDKPKVAVVVEFENKKNNNLGMPMPKGKVRLYKANEESLEFIGEDLIEHTPKDETLKLKVGDAFDIVVEEKEEDNRKIADRVYETSYAIKLKNHKSQDITIDVERNLGSGWEVLDSNIKYEKKDARTILFKVPVKSGEETELKFRIRYNY